MRLGSLSARPWVQGEGRFGHTRLAAVSPASLGDVIIDQLVLASVIAVGVRRLVVSEPAAPAAGDVGDKRSFSAACDVSPGVAEGAVSVAPSDIAMVSAGHNQPPADAYPYMQTMTLVVREGQRLAPGGLRMGEGDVRTADVETQRDDDP